MLEGIFPTKKERLDIDKRWKEEEKMEYDDEEIFSDEPEQEEQVTEED